jgi:hypothetical protein
VTLDPFDGLRPIARGASCCHVLAIREGEGTLVAACGIGCGSMCGNVNFEEGIVRCAEHDEPLCSRCCEIIDEYARTGDWEGVETDHQGDTLCAEPGCSELLFGTPCWCNEHGYTGCEGCEHPAHDCREPGHFCLRHKPEVRD